MKFSQAPSTLVMVRPKAFGFNPQTADTNAFQHASNEVPESIQEKALQEFEKMVDLLRSNDIEVIVVDDSVQPAKPDAVFPNNWISFHPDGTVVLYPMLAENRRAERANPVLESVRQQFRILDAVDLTAYEKQNKFLEGTGSVVFDYVNKIAYAARSPRTDETVLNDLVNKLAFKPIVFDAVDEQGQAIYHTNVLMCIGTGFVVLCLDAIQNDDDQERLLDSFASTHHKVIAISFAQMKQFAGNMFEVMSKSGEPFILMSQRAYHSLLPGQLDALTSFADPIPVDIPTIEDHGGGSVRCMVAGIF
ncbi:MAG TPA: arginine deiminase-related protein [Cyclobacteriaceae bacterium]|nr:amidinotransferase [Cyclobacteriaceae bacterium]HMV09955.1 arginine deiminase-related protein [Cyclobacteriaceae bacterium]HMV90799.1 arginine deiminase-related protein [Cyclobacteriaceae bacterium]HMX01606.1 arginine deiminase-related protein [Cyclobacteriaceae bacterium]HMX50700.1 arginine deiminase-related protein [Cyclobacteriaceae bacterium]